MRIFNFFKIYRAKNQVFFELFDKMADTLVEMSSVFYQGIKDFDLNDDELLKKIGALEHVNDETTHQIYIELSKKNTTLLDGQDIHTLASSLDDIADYIYASAKYIFLYKSPQLAVYQDFAQLIHKACTEIKKAITNFRDFKNFAAVKESCIKINSIENIADDVHSDALLKLFESNDPINIIKVQQVLNYLEEVTDKAEDVANVLDSIIIKHA